MKDKIKSQTVESVESIKLNKKQLATQTWFTDPVTYKMLTIGELTVDQLRTLLWMTLKDQREIDKKLERVCNLLEYCRI